MKNHSDNPSTVRGRPRVDDKRRRILDAALTEFAARGFHGVTIPDVATSAGVGPGTVYRYFADKQDLVNHVFRDAEDRLRATVFDGTPIDASAEGSVLFADLWRRFARFARHDPVGLFKAEWLGHLHLDDAMLARAGDACWAAFRADPAPTVHP
jgi:AcrR family transcriptional regulator